MTTLLRVKGYRIQIFSNDHAVPPHVHVLKGGGISKWSLDPLACTEHKGCGAGDLRRIRRVLIEHIGDILEAWHAEWRKREGL